MMCHFARVALSTLFIFSAASSAATTPAIDSAAAEIQQVAGDHRLLLIGELHGTREVPQLATALVKRYSARGPVLLGLELSRSGQAAIRAYLRSDGGALARIALRAQSFLKPPGGRNDGRRNESMLGLIEEVRLLRAAGSDVAILPIDESVMNGDSGRRDRAMAAYVRRAYRALPRGHVVVLAGNVHAMQHRPDFSGMANMQTPMGEHLADLSPYSINISAAAGKFRACTTTCEWVQAVAAQDASGPASGPYRRSFDYQIVLPQFTPAQLL